MKKICFFSVLIVFLSVNAYAQMSLSLGLGGEVNTYSNGGIAVGYGGLADFRINEMWSIGFHPMMNIDFGPEAFSVLEVTGNVRWYFLRFKNLLNYYFLWQRMFHFFVEFDAGGAFAYLDSDSKLSFNEWVLGGAAGVRIVWEMFYVEPYIRYAATTQVIGAGVLFGVTIRAKDELR
ncbi:MAG: hypothetical protein LBD86_05340 [Spirochaetaceae bacterium]|nr:hypothetical protein [Spirochaetaceae bacterium]